MSTQAARTASRLGTKKCSGVAHMKERTKATYHWYTVTPTDTMITRTASLFHYKRTANVSLTGVEYVEVPVGGVRHVPGIHHVRAPQQPTLKKQKRGYIVKKGAMDADGTVCACHWALGAHTALRTLHKRPTNRPKQTHNRAPNTVLRAVFT
jgi:hypothetical protein